MIEPFPQERICSLLTVRDPYEARFVEASLSFRDDDNDYFYDDDYYY